MVSCRYLRNVKQQIDMLISLRYLQDNWFYLGMFKASCSCVSHAVEFGMAICINCSFTRLVASFSSVGLIFSSVIGKRKS